MADTRPHGSLRFVNALAHLQALGLLVMTVLGGMMMEGVAGAGSWHGPVGESLPVIGLVQVVAALVARRRGAPLWVLWGSVGLLLGSSLIVGMGHASVLSLHVPLATAAFGLAVWMILTLTGRGGMLRSSAPAA